jgi:hypothetical protein
MATMATFFRAVKERFFQCHAGSFSAMEFAAFRIVSRDARA